MDGKPYFSFYHLQNLIHGLGGFQATFEALKEFRRRAEAAGLPGLHLNAVVWGCPVLPGEAENRPRGEVIEGLGFDSTSSYVWVHHVSLPPAAACPYSRAMEDYFKAWDELEGGNGLPYFPNVTMGWDPAPRTENTDVWSPEIGYPFCCTLADNTPENFRIALERTRERLEQRNIPTFNINCWNEWTEGSMLEPEEQYGMGYLDALKKVFRDS